jgi:alpha-tubulin suppressor-like RCC1 family protein
MNRKLFAILAVFLLWPARYATSETLAAGPQHVLLVTPDGKVWSWGYAGSGRLGNGAVSDAFLPAPIAGLTDVIGVAAGREHSVAVRRDGTVWVWGDNSRGQLGSGGGPGTAVPIKVQDLTGISAITAGDDHTLAWSVDGGVWAQPGRIEQELHLRPQRQPDRRWNQDLRVGCRKPPPGRQPGR